MKGLFGRPGTFSGLMLRLGQCGFGAASIGVMVTSSGFSSYTAFCYLIASLGLQVLWSLGLACLDVYALRRKRHLQNPILVSLLVVGDWVTTTLSLAAACSSAGIAILYARDMDICKTHKNIPCGRYQVSVAYGIYHLGSYCGLISCDVLDLSLSVAHFILGGQTTHKQNSIFYTIL
ncbi:CASP-like protein [Quillaja saponaria]|uniref:CASP-like protein n=1 Tax=Quillaja saponaria TaxID=32244 RepID=A0AAD7LQY4_QUISA|nr:CASP-like protein [Quillaja saponaria]